MNIQTVTFQNISFLSVTNPKELELKYLKNNFGFSPLHLDDYIHKTQVPKIEIEKAYVLVVLDFPYFSQNENASWGPAFPGLPQVSFPPLAAADKKRRIVQSQVDFFLGKDFLVVLHDGMLPQIDSIFSHCQKTLRKRTELMEKGPVFLFYHIVDALVDSCFPVINELSATIDRIDRDLETSQSEKILEDISTTRRNIVVFHTMIKPMISLFRELKEGRYRELNHGLTPFWENISDHLQKIWDRLEDNRELIVGISESNESLLSSRTNKIVTVLTIFSAIILPLNLIASIYGMNIEGLPFAQSHSAFATITAFMFFLGVVMLFLFKTRNWL